MIKIFIIKDHCNDYDCYYKGCLTEMAQTTLSSSLFNNDILLKNNYTKMGYSSMPHFHKMSSLH